MAGRLYRLAVAPAWRRRGVGSRLLDEAGSRLRELGARRVGAMVIAEHDDAVAFWVARGYDADPRSGDSCGCSEGLQSASETAVYSERQLHMGVYWLRLGRSPSGRSGP
jgi:ribosomal protein S18 acetylase RimI-like enzyme